MTGAVALANASRGLIEAAQGRLAETRTWAVNEKGIVERTGLGPLADALLAAGDRAELAAAIERARRDLPGEPLAAFAR